MKVDAASPKAGGSKVAADFPSGAKGFAVHEQLRHRIFQVPNYSALDVRFLIDPQEACHRTEIRSERSNRADIEIPIGPTIKPAANTGREGIVNCGMTQGTLNTDRLQISCVVEKTC